MCHQLLTTLAFSLTRPSFPLPYVIPTTIFVLFELNDTIPWRNLVRLLPVSHVSISHETKHFSRSRRTKICPHWMLIPAKGGITYQCQSYHELVVAIEEVSTVIYDLRDKSIATSTYLNAPLHSSNDCFSIRAVWNITLSSIETIYLGAGKQWRVIGGTGTVEQKYQLDFCRSVCI